MDKMEIRFSTPGLRESIKGIIIFLFTPIYLLSKVPWGATNMMVMWQITYCITGIIWVAVSIVLIHSWWFLVGWWFGFCLYYWLFKLGMTVYGDDWTA